MMQRRIRAKVTPVGSTLLLLILLAPIPSAWSVERLPVLARVGPWPAISQFASYRGRLWFANSVKGVNHNSADLYTYDPGTGKVRYERHLFSQDVGDPLVAGGLLYWPFEDSRFSLGWGHFMVTNGQRWRFGTIPTAYIFHSHAMALQDERLVAATSAWRGGLQVSSDGGLNWRAVYDHPTQHARVSRIVTLASLGSTVIGYVKERRDGKDLRRLLRLRKDAVSEVPGWPRDRAVSAMAATGEAIYAAVNMPGGTVIWRSDGDCSRAITAPRRNWHLRGLAAGGEGLWAVTAGKGSGKVWFSRSGTAWSLRYELAGGKPRQITLYGGKPYVGGEGADGRGILWGPNRPVPLEEISRKVPRLPNIPGPAGAVDWAKAEDKLKRAIGNVGGSDARGRSVRDFVYQYAAAGPPPELFSRLLGWVHRPGEIPLFGGKARIRLTTYVRWILLWGVGISGKGAVPLELISEPWDTPPNYPEKYFQSPPAAMWAAAMVKQDDRETIGALIDRLGRKGEPLWLKGDAVGALTVLTEQRFAYDFEAWRKWWRAAEPYWLR